MDVKLTLEVNPAHLEALERYFIMLDASLGKGIDGLRLKAASGHKEAMQTVDEMRATQRYIGDLCRAIAFARETHFSQEEIDEHVVRNDLPAKGFENAKD